MLKSSKKERFFKLMISFFRATIFMCTFTVSYAKAHMCFSDYFPLSLIITLYYSVVDFNLSLSMDFTSMNSVKLSTKVDVGTYELASQEES